VWGLCRTGSGALVEDDDESFMGSIGLTMEAVVGLDSRDEGARAEFPTSVLGINFAALFIATEGVRDMEDSALIGITELSVGVPDSIFRCFACLE
jgi:hypothetical protein